MEKENFLIGVTLTSSLQADEKYLSLTRDLAKLLAKNGMGIVYGGTAYGMMKELAETYKLSGGNNLVGVLSEELSEATINYVPFEKLDKKILVQTMEERKHSINRFADGFFILPGGYGTFEEIGSILGSRVNKLSDKPICFINIDGFYDDLLNFLESLQDRKMSKISIRDICCVTDNLEDALQYCMNYEPAELVDKFI